MKESKTGNRLTLTQRIDAGNVPAPWVPPDDLPASDTGNVPAPWVPPELPASDAAPGRAVAKLDPTKSPPAPWVPPSTAAPVANADDRGKLKPWMPPADAPRKMPAVIVEDENEAPAPKKQKKKRRKERSGELTSQNTGGGQTVVNIVNQVAAPAPVYVSPWWGWWGGGCPNVTCPRHAGRACFRVWCWHW
jgi:hypothetical protein